MKLRQIIIVLAAIAILAGGKFISNKLGEPKEKPARATRSNVTTVFTESVQNSKITIYVESTGLLKALDRMELYSEVQGVMLPDGGRFKPGNTFNKGSVLVGIRADDQRAQLVASRSVFERLLSSVMPDLRLDFTDAFPVWQAYLQTMDVEAPLKDLPEVNSEKLKLFLTGRNVFSEYYSLKNKEIVLTKYNVRAPYNGLLVQANADPGTVIRPGQALGVFIRPGVYELEAAVNVATASRLRIGQEVELKMDSYSSQIWKGEISRVNNAIDPESQMSQFFVQVESGELKDGTFMQARVEARSEENAVEIPRSVLLDGNKVFVVENGMLVQHEIEALHFNERTVVVRGLTDGIEFLTKVPPGAFAGMAVNIYQEKVAQ